MDCSDTTCFEETAKELHSLFGHEEMRNTKVLVLANKRDLPHAVTEAELAKKLNLRNLKGHLWYIQGCSATNGTGQYEGVDWLSSVVSSTAR